MKIILDIGCGNDKLKPGKGEKVIGIDHMKYPGVDIVHDLEKPLPLKSNFADRVYSNHTFEHIRNIVPLIEQCWKVTKPTGELFIRVPHFTSAGMYTDLTHTTFFSSRSFDFFIPGTYLFTMSGFNKRIKFSVLEKRIICYPPYKLLEPIINHSDFTRKLYEYLFCWILPGNEIIFRLRPIK